MTLRHAMTRKGGRQPFVHTRLSLTLLHMTDGDAPARDLGVIISPRLRHHADVGRCRVRISVSVAACERQHVRSTPTSRQDTQCRI